MRINMARYRMARVLRFTLLAPDIIEAILGGCKPDGFTLKRLASQIPALWSEQRKKYGLLNLNWCSRSMPKCCILRQVG